ncbi:MAG TPA: protein kinase [Gemmatimonadales bacterium]|jgi:serine/threonine protein kinase|nr:protein kinase [Gemmatimonadales bacterium]
MYCSRCGTQFQDDVKFCPSCGLEVGGAATTPVKAIASGEMTELDIVKEALNVEYEIQQELGRGGMAIVYKAKDKQLEREVAVKVLPFSLAFDAEFVERFQREARTAAQLEHPNIIPIYRVGKSGRVIFFVMKFLRGKSLSTVLRDRGRLGPPEIRRLLLEAGSALGHAAKHGIVHRDIKPDNIMFDEFGQCVVTDFGIAKAASGQKLTGTGMSIGTPHYMSPEQARAQPIDGRSDIYSLGIVAYQCLVGQVPYDGDDSFSIGYKHIMEPIPEPELPGPDERQLFEVIRRMIAKDPAERFQSCDELVQALEGGAIAGPATGAARFATANRAAAAATTPLPRIAEPLPGAVKPTVRSPGQGARPVASRPRPEEKKSSFGAILGALLVIGGAGGGAYYAFVLRPAQQAAATPAAPTAPASADTLAARDSALINAALTPPAAGAESTAAAAGTPATTTAPAAATAPAATPADSGTLRIPVPLPAGAVVMVDGARMTSNPFKVPAGDRQVLITARGYDNFVQTVRVTKGQETPLRPDLRRLGGRLAGNAQPAPGGRTIAPITRAAVNCSDPEQEGYNRGGSCFDEAPRNADETPPAVPTDDPGMQVARAPIFWFRVGTDGTTREVRVLRPSNDPNFQALALRYARAMRWRPATKNGDEVEAWAQRQLPPTPP